MARIGKKSSDKTHRAAPEPVNVAERIPDRSAKRPLWVYVVLALVFLGWVAFLAICRIAAAP